MDMKERIAVLSLSPRSGVGTLRSTGVLSLLLLLALLPIPVSPVSEGKGVVVFTFDDGFATDYTVVLPIFQNYGVWGTSYVAVQALRPHDALDFMDVSMLRQLVASGWDVESHGFSHSVQTLQTRMIGCPTGDLVTVEDDRRIGAGAGLELRRGSSVIHRSVVWKDGEGTLALDWRLPSWFCGATVTLSEGGKRIDFERVVDWFQVKAFPYPRHFAFPYGVFGTGLVNLALTYHDTYRVTTETAGYNYAALGENKLVGWEADDKLRTLQGMAEIKRRIDKVAEEDWLLVLIFHEVTSVYAPALEEVLRYAIQESTVMSVTEYWPAHGELP